MKNLISNVLIILFISSCSISNKIIKTKVNTKKMVDRLFEKNGNAFYVNSTYVIISFVWSYSDNKISIYKLSGNKILENKNFIMNERIFFIQQLSKEELQELDKCIELDGDGFGYKFKKDGKVEEQDFPINLECFTQKKYKSAFLNKVVSDIKTYKIE